MPRKSTTISVVPEFQEPLDDLDEPKMIAAPISLENGKATETEDLQRMLAAVLEYLSDDEVEEIDIEVILDKTTGLREWWDQYRESNKKHIEEEITKSLADLSLKDLESLREQIKGLKVH